MNTGLRRSELFHLRGEDIDFEAKWLTVQGVSSKNGQTRRIPLNAEALSTLETWRTLRRRANPKFFRRRRGTNIHAALRYAADSLAHEEVVRSVAG